MFHQGKKQEVFCKWNLKKKEKIKTLANSFEIHDHHGI